MTKQELIVEGLPRLLDQLDKNTDPEIYVLIGVINIVMMMGKEKEMLEYNKDFLAPLIQHMASAFAGIMPPDILEDFKKHISGEDPKDWPKEI